jgi:tripartite-type tricarboxylate transporter receptor subunit TctC
VGNAPGGGIDIIARLLASRMSDSLGHAVIVENHPGAAARIANQYVAKAPSDGHTLLVSTAAGALDTSGVARPSADALRDFAPVSTIARTSMVLVVNPSVPVKDLAALLARARAMPGQLNYASSGTGTTGNLFGELFKLRTGTDIVHVPYKGTAPALNALLAGDVDMSFIPVPGARQFVSAGRLRALATTGEERSALMPEVPTMQEAGTSGLAASVWYGVFAPAGTPSEIVAVLAAAIRDATLATDFRQRLLDLGAEPAAMAPAAFGDLLRSEATRWNEVGKAAGIRTD